jgi:recombination protein RecA
MAKKKSAIVTLDEINIDIIDWTGIGKEGADLFEKVEPVDYWIDTGCLALNYICSGKMIGGGIPGGRITEIIGGSSTGKTVIGTNILGGVQAMGGIPVLLDAEQTFNPDFASKISKLDTNCMLTISADTLEGCFNKIYNALRIIRSKVPVSKPIVILFDSIAACPSEREFAETTLDMEAASKSEIKEAGAGADQPGDRAKVCSKHFRNLPRVLHDNNASLVVINQFRSKIGVMFGNPNTSGGGGRALEYYGSIRLELTGTKKTKDKYDVVNGVNLHAKNIKNKCFQPFLEASELHLLFNKGINPFGGLLQLLIQTERISGKGGNYEVLEPYAQGKTIKFRSSLERNDVPPEVLLACPQLVDAVNEQQIKQYIDRYDLAIKGMTTDIASEETFTEE